MTKTPQNFTAALLADGWKRCDYELDEIGECVALSGCSRPGRWSHPHVTGNYCAQHALNGD